MDYNELRGKIYEVFGSIKRFSEAMNLSYPTILGKLAGSTEWTKAEMLKACELLKIKVKDIPRYFFASAVK